MKTLIFSSTFLLFIGCSEPNVDNDFKLRHPNCKLIQAVKGEGDNSIVYMHITFLKPRAIENSEEIWQYWNRPEGWTHREIHLLNDTINDRSILTNTTNLAGTWQNGDNTQKGQWKFQRDHTFIFNDNSRTINGVWFHDLYNIIRLYHHTIIDKSNDSKKLIDEVFEMTYDTLGDTIYFENIENKK